MLDLITTFEKQTGIKINKVFSDRRQGDIASCWADAEKANKLLNWKAEKISPQCYMTHGIGNKSSHTGSKMYDLSQSILFM